MKQKTSKIDILGMIACVLIAVGYFIASVFFGNSHVCTRCKTLIHSNEDCVICNGRYYYHTYCYAEKLKEESK